jgi:hypothetical protein
MTKMGNSSKERGNFPEKIITKDAKKKEDEGQSLFYSGFLLLLGCFFCFWGYNPVNKCITLFSHSGYYAQFKQYIQGLLRQHPGNSCFFRQICRSKLLFFFKRDKTAVIGGFFQADTFMYGYQLAVPDAQALPPP